MASGMRDPYQTQAFAPKSVAVAPWHSKEDTWYVLEIDSCWKTWVHLSHPYYRKSHHFSKVLIACVQAQDAHLPKKGFCTTSCLLLFLSLSAAKTPVSCKKKSAGHCSSPKIRCEPPLAPDRMAGYQFDELGGDKNMRLRVTSQKLKLFHFKQELTNSKGGVGIVLGGTGVEMLSEATWLWETKTQSASQFFTCWASRFFGTFSKFMQ